MLNLIILACIYLSKFFIISLFHILYSFETENQLVNNVMPLSHCTPCSEKKWYILFST